MTHDSISAIAFVYRLNDVRNLLIRKIDDFPQIVDYDFERLSPKQAFLTLLREIKLIGFEPDYSSMFGDDNYVVPETTKEKRIRILGTENMRLEGELKNAKKELESSRRELESLRRELENLKRISDAKRTKHIDEVKRGKKIAYKDNVTPEDVRKYYYEHSKNVSDTANHFKISRNTVYARLKEAGEKPRKKK